MSRAPLRCDFPAATGILVSIGACLVLWFALVAWSLA